MDFQVAGEDVFCVRLVHQRVTSCEEFLGCGGDAWQ
jgi:hypothetical protein